MRGLRIGVGVGVGMRRAPASAAVIVPQVYRFDSSLVDAASGAKTLSVISGSALYGTGKFTGSLGDPVGSVAQAVTAGRAQDLLTGALDSASYSLSCWLNATNNSNTGLESFDIQFKDNAGVVQFHLISSFRSTGGGGLEKAFIGFNNDATVSSNNNTFVQLGWHHVAASVSGGLAQLWIDGVQKTTNLAVPAGLTFDPTGTFRVIQATQMGGDDLGIKQAALTQANVDAIYAAGVGSLYPTS